MIAAIGARIIEPIDKLLDQMNSETAGSRLATRLRRCWTRYSARIKWLAVVDDHNFYFLLLHANVDLELMRSALGPSVLYDIAKQLVERDLELRHDPTGN